MSGPAQVLEEVANLAEEHAAKLEGYWNDETRPHVARMLVESATVAVRATSGEDVGVAQVALDSSMKNLSRVQQSVVQLQGRELALRAALKVVSGLAAG